MAVVKSQLIKDLSKNYPNFLKKDLEKFFNIILNEIKNSELGIYCKALDQLSLNECLPIIKNCSVSICNDTSFSHLSSALGIDTITLMADTPLMYGNYSSKMHPVLPDDVNEVTHGTLGKDKINPQKILDKLNSIIH